MCWWLIEEGLGFRNLEDGTIGYLVDYLTDVWWGRNVLLGFQALHFKNFVVGVKCLIMLEI